MNECAKAFLTYKSGLQFVKIAQVHAKVGMLDEAALKEYDAAVSIFEALFGSAFDDEENGIRNFMSTGNEGKPQTMLSFQCITDGVRALIVSMNKSIETYSTNLIQKESTCMVDTFTLAYQALWLAVRVGVLYIRDG